MKCLTCKHWSPKKAGQLGRFGFGQCANLPAWNTPSAEHSCAKFKTAPDAEKRTAWDAALSEKHAKHGG